MQTTTNGSAAMMMKASERAAGPVADLVTRVLIRVPN
jgi:hypothetical protein